jgi:hypothetical protein
MIAFKDSFESEEDKIKKALKNLMKAVEEVDTQSLLDEVNSSTHLDTNLSEIIDLLYQSLFVDNNNSVSLFVTKNQDNSLDCTIEHL